MGELLGRTDLTAPITDNFQAVQTPPGAVTIDFSLPGALDAQIDWSVRNGTAAVVGTTGLSDAQREHLTACSGDIPIVFAPNMSVGVNTLFKIVADVVRILGENYDVEITEIHHRFKRDAPSGTARRLGEIVAEAMGGSYDELVVDGRSGITGERPSRQIGMHALRGGDVVGEHTVTFAGLGERVELTHRASSRETFARGAVRAVKFLMAAAPGLYDMQDVLGLR